MQVVEGYKHFGALALVIYWLTVATILSMHWGGKGLSISGHVTIRKRVTVVFGLTCSLCLLLLYLFMTRWFFGALHTSEIFNFAVYVSGLGFIVTSLVPDLKGLAHTVHLFAAQVASVALLPGVILLASNNYVSNKARLVCWLATVIMLAIVVVMTTKKDAQDRLLLLEAGFFMCFDVAIVAATYIR